MSQGETGDIKGNETSNEIGYNNIVEDEIKLSTNVRYTKDRKMKV